MTLYSDGLEKEHPQECKEIRQDEREKTLNEIRWAIAEVSHGRHKHTITEFVDMVFDDLNEQIATVHDNNSTQHDYYLGVSAGLQRAKNAINQKLKEVSE